MTCGIERRIIWMGSVLVTHLFIGEQILFENRHRGHDWREVVSPVVHMDCGVSQQFAPLSLFKP